jgi:polar amino acid transport system substrate-binding protein
VRRLLILAIPLSALALTVAGTGGGAVTAPSASCTKASLKTVASGKLTVGTDNPAYPPWFGGNPGHGWKVSDPYSGKGFESAVAYAVARELGFARGEVRWTYTPFAKSYAPGPKKFDFDINEISFTTARAQVVDFSNSYYDVNQALVVNEGTPIASVHSIAALRKYKLGAQLGTTSYDYIANVIKPASRAVYTSNDKAVFALKAKLIDGLVVDLPTAFYVTAVQVPHSKILGQFANRGANPEHFGMVLRKGNPLTGCVNQALARMKSSGTLAQIQKTWLSKVVGVPLLK